MTAILQRLKQRKLFQWGLAYLAGAWVTLQVLDLLADAFGWPVEDVPGAPTAGPSSPPSLPEVLQLISVPSAS